jgi:hypothetical protein
LKEEEVYPVSTFLFYLYDFYAYAYTFGRHIWVGRGEGATLKQAHLFREGTVKKTRLNVKL